MGSSGSAGVDFGVGPIVWVRRRNGSWWPGKILGSDELSDCNLTSPRTGTPVKLLGREDASVDWYNLEKSKRVKAFRCGEFDDCIERAESAHGMPIKKREKYARREDAILHALELEKHLLEKQGKFSAASDPQRSKSSGSAKEPSVSSEGLENNVGKSGNANLNLHSNRTDSGIKVGIVGTAINKKEENQSILGDDHSEATPQMIGLQDLWLKTTPLKRKFPSPIDSDGYEKPMLDNGFQVRSFGASMERRIDANGVEQVGAFCQAKRSRCIFLPSESNDSLDDKDHPSNQNKMFPSELADDDDNANHHGSLNEQNSSSGFMEDVESDSSETESSHSESDSSETELGMDDEMTGFQDAAISSEAERKALRQHEAPGEHGSISSEEFDELAFTSEIHQYHPSQPFLGNETVSKWQLKGKRHIRNLTKRSVDGKILNIPLEDYYKRKGTTCTYGFDGVDLSRKYFGTQTVGPNNGCYPYARRFLSKGRNGNGTGCSNMIGWGEMTWDDGLAYRGGCELRMENFNPIFFSKHFGGWRRSVLIDVDLKVQASYQKERVPIVSLVSKLNGKAIIGYPIQIEALEEDGLSGTFVSMNDYHSIKAVDHDGNTQHPPAWRTNLRIPRPHLSSVLACEDPLSIHQEQKFLFKKANTASSGHKAGMGRKSLPHISRFPRKLPKIESLSIAGQQNFGVKPIHHISGGRMDGIIKSETSGPTTVACIPVKLVFSRLLEKINRPPSKVKLLCQIGTQRDKHHS